LYEKADRSPKAGSLKEALFLHVWLRRQEIEVNKVKVLAQGLADLTASQGGNEHVIKAFKDFTAAVFPFAAQAQTATDKAMVDQMRKEVAKGPIFFKPMENNILRDTARRLAMPDDFKKKLQESRTVRARRR
jgi:hypothetical protein